ncbi:MAG: hypothetical protein L3J43_04905 [Sulfurovum sp.]|nr:hypothetical protein [Sulfurovum sp.]
MKKIIALFVCVLLINGCSLVGLTVPSSIDDELHGSWTPVNNNSVKAYNE